MIANDGVPGVDGFEVETLAKNEAYRAAWLLALAEELRTKTYRPSPVLRVYIWKDQAKTKRRALGIPTVKDRVVQSAAAIVLQPIWEADFHDHSYAYRPKRRSHQAMDTVRAALLSGKVEVVDADLSSYFDMIPHRELLQLVAKRVAGSTEVKAQRRENSAGGHTKGGLRVPRFCGRMAAITEEQTKLSARGAQREKPSEVTRQSAGSAGGANAQPTGGGGGPQGQPDHTRMGDGVSLRQQLARVW